MRVKEVADLAGVTVRTIRYYHQIGLLPVPEVRHGSRDYDLVHVARLIRVRWLTQAGVPLSRVAGMLQPAERSAPTGREADREGVLTDLNATVIALDEQLEQLRAQRGRIQHLIASVEQHDQLSPMPPAVLRFYEDMERRATDDDVRRVIRRERNFMELAYYRGDIPDGAEASYHGFDEARLAESLAVFGQIVERAESASPPTEEEIAQTVARVIERIRRHLGPGLPEVARSIDLHVARRAADLYVRLGDKKERQINRAIADALLQILEVERSR